MHRFRLKKTLSSILLFAFLSACNATSDSVKSSFDAYLPDAFSSNEDFSGSYFKQSEKTSPQKNSTVWDVSDTDVSYVDFQKKHVAFTFDDAPARTLENILAVFASFNERNEKCAATATVFVNGALCGEHGLQLLHTAYALGFELGNHTQSHLDLTALDEQKLRSEIAQTDALLTRVDRKPVHLLRAPFGKIDEQVRRVADAPLIDWTIDTLDWSGVTADEICDKVLSEVYDGCIVLMHDGYENTVEAVKRLLPRLQEADYQVLSVSALAKTNGCTLHRGNVYIRARKRRA